MIMIISRKLSKYFWYKTINLTWQMVEKENQIYQQYISNSERAIVPYYNVINVLSLCINIVYMCIINFMVVPGI